MVMSKQAQHPRHLSSHHSTERLKNGATRQSALQPKTAGLRPTPAAQGIARRTPVAPPVYRPQTASKILQAKTAHATQKTRQPNAPPVYRPQPIPKVMQTKMAAVQQPQATQSRRQPVAPPAYRPQPTPKVLQRKESQPTSLHTNGAMKVSADGLRPRAVVNQATVQTKMRLHLTQRRTLAQLPRGTVAQCSKANTTTKCVACDQPAVFGGNMCEGCISAMSDDYAPPSLSSSSVSAQQQQHSQHYNNFSSSSYNSSQQQQKQQQTQSSSQKQQQLQHHQQSNINNIKPTSVAPQQTPQVSNFQSSISSSSKSKPEQQQKKLSQDERDDRILQMGDTLFSSELLETDYGNIEGMQRFRSSVMQIGTQSDDFYPKLQGFNYQLAQTEILHKQEKVKSVETQYKGQSGSNRYADIETVEGQYIDCKAYASSYNPSEETKEKFREQAQDYSRSGKPLIYLFSNNPPEWAAKILNEFKLKWEVKK
jgi:hypothetical protein